jgi:hypothetical protein
MSRHEIRSPAFGVVAALALATLAFVPVPAAAQSCAPLVSRYDGSRWWWGAFGNCKRPGGPTDRNAIFTCAWNQVPTADQTACLRTALQNSVQTRQGIDVVVAANTPPPPPPCAQLVSKYDGSRWWWGAFGNCKRPGGPTDRRAIFECAWNQVPANEKTACLHDTLLRTDQTRQATDEVFEFNRTDTIAKNMSTIPFQAPEACDHPDSGAGPQRRAVMPFDVVNGQRVPLYFSPSVPQSLLDTTLPPGRVFNDPPAHNIGLNEGRLRASLRAAARVADPMSCSLHLSAIHYARGETETAQAFADLSVTGRRAFARFRGSPPNEASCQRLVTLPLAGGCLPPGTSAAAAPGGAALIDGCHRALDRAYRVANYLRTGQALRVALPWFTTSGQLTPAANAERIRKATERSSLGWIAVSGEDDQPLRPVNVPSSDFPQYDIEVNVEAPLARPPHPTTVTVRTRYVIAQSKAPAPAGPAIKRPPLERGKLGQSWRLETESAPSIAPDAEILLFVHGMDSRAEEADDITRELHKLAAKGTRNATVISVDLPTSGYAQNLDFEAVSPLAEIGAPKWTPLPIPIVIPPPLSELLRIVPGFALAVPPGVPLAIPPGTPIPDFGATGRTPLLDFIETFIVRFVETLDRQTPVKNKIKAVMGGSLGGNMTFRLGRRPNVEWLPNFIVWSPASIWDSLGEGADILKHLGPRGAWESAEKASRSPSDADRQAFFGGWDKAIVPVLIPEAQSDTWQSEFYACKKTAVASARLDRHETYDARFLAWHWRLGGEQLLYSHQSIDSSTRQPRFKSNRKPMLLACGKEDHVLFNDICGATQRTAPHMTATPGKALFLEQTGHSVDNERRVFWAREIARFLRL